VKRLRHLLLVGLVAGVIAGLAASVLQAFLVTPLILEAERSEAALGPVAGSERQSHGHEFSPLQRGGLTFVSNTLAGIGFGLLLAAAYSLRGAVNWRAGVAWGLAGFAAFYLAPSIGLPPSLPGSDLAELGARQGWWLGTAAATALGLALLLLGRPAWAKGLGIVLLIVPHLIGAPQQAGRFGPPSELAEAFILWSGLAAAVFWLVLGASSGWLFARLDRPIQ
jgi:cobalt transporter subunit CbtA